MIRSFATFVTALIASAALPASSQEAPEGPETAAKRVGVFALDDSVRTQKLDEDVANALSNAGLVVIHGYNLQSVIDRSTVPPPNNELAGRFSSVSSVVGEGIKAFFYEGDETAIERLSPVFDLGITHREVLARRPDLADQVYEAGVVLLRAYQNAGKDEEMAAVASLLVKTFPSRSPSPETVPPKIIKYLEARAAELASTGTELEFVGVGRGECIGYVNGGRVDANAFPVAPDFDYFLRLDCGKSDAVVWRATAQAGKRAVIPVPSINPLDHEMSSSDTETRRLTEDYMATLAHWARLNAVVGVSRKAAPGDDGVLVGRMERGTTSWSDGVQNKSVRTALQRVFPELAGSIPSMETSQTEARSTTDWLGWSLTGGGAVVAGSGAAILVLAEQRTVELRCTDQSSNPLPASECGENILDGLSRDEAADEYDRLLSEVRRNRIIGWSLVGVGAVAAGYGIYRLATAPDEPASSVVILPTFGRESAGAALLVQF